jgi:aspartate/methionine/tyrosine aminotransferase
MNTLKNVVKESTIRRMTRLAHEYGAVNLSQGFPNEGPPMTVRLALAHAVLAGTPVVETGEGLENGEKDLHHRSLCRILSNPSSSDAVILDTLNQYSPPMGTDLVRKSIASYYRNLYQYEVDPDDITVTLGATEALACALRSLGRPGQKVVIFEPFHELYPSQCNLFYLEASFVTLRPSHDNKTWTFDLQELEATLKDARVLILNTPHNPTGKIFTRNELQSIVDLCLKYKVYIVTDEIYEHMCYSEKHDHILLPQAFPEIKDWCLACNSMGKSASATGWRLGWCLHPPHISTSYRGIHDQIAVMSPHPVQYAALTYFALPESYFREELKTRYKGRIDQLAKTLNALDFGVVAPEGAYYLFVKYKKVKALAKFENPMDAAMYLLKEVGVACVPGDNFYGKAIEDEGKQYVRFAACRSEGDIKEACARLTKHLQA